MINECDQLNTKPLDQTQNVMLKDTKRYFDASFQGDTVPRHIRGKHLKLCFLKTSSKIMLDILGR